jgi:putative DNA primase/helicase
MKSIMRNGMFLHVNVAMIPEILKKYPNWVCWRSEIEKGRIKKIPIDPKTGKKASPNNPDSWGTFSEGVNYWTTHRANVKGIGFVLTNTPFTGVDLDKCRKPRTGGITRWAGKIVAEMNSYTEITPSGMGLHILAEGKLPPGGHRKGNVEMYDTGRFFTITGQHLKGTPTSIKDRQKELKKLHSRIFGVKGQKPASSRKLRSEAQKSPRLPDSDLIQKAMRARNGDEFSRLWSGDWSGYNSQSEADFRLCCMLAFWTGKNPKRIDRLFRQSGLMREKWDERRGDKTYGEITIQRAVEMTREVYSPRF